MPFARPSLFDRPSSRGLVPALVAFVLLAAPTVASASCGSHVRLPGDRMAGEHCTPGVDCPLAPAAPKPCHGPGCSQGPESQPLAPLAAPAPLTDDPALAPTLAWLPEAEGRLGRPRDSSFTTHHVSPPDPPPRIRADS